jgi:hypothetical protein
MFDTSGIHPKDFRKHYCKLMGNGAMMDGFRGRCYKVSAAPVKFQPQAPERKIMPKVTQTMADPKTALYQAFWRKVLETGKPIEFPHKTQSDAKYFRLSLYRAVTRYREESGLDAELHEATQKCAVGIAPDKTTVVLKMKIAEQSVLDIAKSLGIDVDALKQAPVDALSLEAEAASQRMMERLEMGLEKPVEDPSVPAPKKFHNPYGSRS